jgi:16S rRNA (adenine1518-N6/adenine1519-N6)-dimethyltransferase
MNPHDTLRQLGIDPKKSLGQNFMVQPGALRQMADAAEVGSGDAVLEIGAGLGALTDLLAERARRVVAVEIDGRFVPYLKRRYAACPWVEIVQGDILALDLAALMGADAGDYRVVANLPYYITSAVIRHLLESPAPPRRLVITVQREVAERITAPAGELSLLAISVQVYGAARVVAHLKAGNFYPPPNVDSAVVRIDPYPAGPPIAPEEAPTFFRIARAGFSQPRKQIKNSLAAGLGLEPQAAVEWLAAAGIDPRRRPETLTLEEWLALHRLAGEWVGHV